MGELRCRQTNSVANKAYLNGQTTDFYKILRLPTIPYFSRTLPFFEFEFNVEVEFDVDVEVVFWVMFD